MYEAHYGLTTKPFSIVPNPEILFLSKNHANALTYLEYGLSEKAGFILLTGEIGAGKTTLVRHILNKIHSQADIAVIYNTNFSSDQLFRRILGEFEIACHTTDKESHLALLYQYLIDRYAQQRHVLLIIDEAQNLPDDALEDIRMLSNLQTDDQILLQIMLVGQPELKDRLSLPDFRQIAQRIAVNYHIGPLDEAQTRRYIGYRIQKAGGDPDLFSAQAIQLIHARSGGIPRTINLLCDTALVYGFADNLTQIDEAVVGKVLEDKICMSVSEGKQEGRSVKRVASRSEAGPGILERIHWLEATLSQLRQQHERLVHEVKNDLQLKYVKLLDTERRRYDVLLEKYSRLRAGATAPEPVERPEGGGAAPPPSVGKVKPRNKFAHLMKIAKNRNPSTKEG